MATPLVRSADVAVFRRGRSRVSSPQQVRRHRVRAGAGHPTRVPVAACFGGGGAYGIGFNLGVATGLQDAGIDVLGGPMLGTSAGAYAAAALRSGVSFEAVMSAWPRQLEWRVARAHDVTGPMFGGHHDPDVAA